jgi:4-hydroxy-tetrahydrodipicolinate synthase
MVDDTAIRRLEGISGVPVTPFTPTLEVDDTALAAVVERMAGQGVQVIVPNGGTGEFSELTPDERERVARIVIETVPDALVLCGVGGDARGAARATATALAHGADGVLLHALTDPFVTADGIVRYIEQIAAAGDGIVVPYLRGRLPAPAALERIVALEQVVAIKWAIPDVQQFATFVERYGDQVIPICGLAELWAPFFALAGGRGFTSGLVNVDAEPSLGLLASLNAGDWPAAMRAWHAIKPFEEIRARHDAGNNVPAVKEAMELRGLLACSAVRPPLAPLSAADRRDLADALTLLTASAAA